MSDEAKIILTLLAVLLMALGALLVGLLCIKLFSALERYNPAQGTGKPIDVAKLKLRIEDVRHDYVAARQRQKGVCFHWALLQFTLRAVARFAYFRDRESQQNASTHGPSTL